MTTAAAPLVASEIPQPTAAPVRAIAVDRRPVVRAGLRRIAREACGGRALAVRDLARAATARRMLGGELRVLLLGLSGGDDPAALMDHAHRLAPVVIAVLE